MKRANTIKTIELIVFIALSLFFVYIVRSSTALRTLAAQYSEIRTLVYALWLLIAAVFVMFFVDFSVISHEQKEFANLSMALHSDTLSQIANRNGCDQLIEKYIDKELPDGFACVMLVLTNIYEINEKIGRAAGNQAIQDFSVILHMAARDIGFAGRNGGNKFILLFENEEGASECEQCLKRIRQKVNEYNSMGGVDLEYAYGEAIAHTGDGHKIHDLIALADRSVDYNAAKTDGKADEGTEPENDSV